MPKNPYGGKWPKVRLAVLARDGYLCQIKGPGCTTKATCVDHIVPPEDGGSWWDQSNLRAACFQCNNARRGQYKGRAWRSNHTQITLVTGDPAAVSVYLATHVGQTDYVADYTIQSEQTYGILVDALRTGKVSAPRAWITSPTPDATLPHHHHISLTNSDAITVSPAGAPTSRTW